MVVVSHFIMLKLNFMIRATILILSICTYSKNPHNNLHFFTSNSGNYGNQWRNEDFSRLRH